MLTDRNSSGRFDHQGHGGKFGGHGGFGGGHGGRGGRGGHGGGGYRALVQGDGTHLLFIGSYSCVRHQGTERLQLQQEGKLSFLCLQEIDWITGDYLPQIEEAAREVLELYPVKKLILFGGCQLELLSVDMDSVCKDISDQLGIPVAFHKGCHLVGYGQEGVNDR